MKNIFRDFLTFNKRERNGVFVLLSIIGTLVLYLNISSKFINEQPVDFTKFDAEVKAFKQNTIEKESTQEYPEKVITAELDNNEAERFNFNPNGLSESSWKRLGLSDKQIQSIKKYEAKGGKFRTKQDVKKMYCIKTEQYESLEPYIQIASPAEQGRIELKPKSIFQDGKVESTSTLTTSKKESFVIVELNTADSAMLTSIKGIGAFYAKNIIKYRNSIGGFVSKEQLLEIWKFDQEKLNSIEKFIDIDVSKIKKININTCEAADLKNEYVKWAVANGIVNYRKNHGKYKTVDEIKKTDLVDEETYRKIAPYLIVE
ncbi:helix-hairpin-helix domain-containing protein [soil metagenome]